MSTPTDSDVTLVGALEAAEILGLKRGHVNKLAQAGVLKTHTKIPGRTGARLFSTIELERFKAENFRPGPVVSYDAVTS